MQHSRVDYKCVFLFFFAYPHTEERWTMALAFLTTYCGREAASGRGSRKLFLPLRLTPCKSYRKVSLLLCLPAITNAERIGPRGPFTCIRSSGSDNATRLYLFVAAALISTVYPLGIGLSVDCVVQDVCNSVESPK